MSSAGILYLACDWYPIAIVTSAATSTTTTTHLMAHPAVVDLGVQDSPPRRAECRGTQAGLRHAPERGERMRRGRWRKWREDEQRVTWYFYCHETAVHHC